MATALITVGVLPPASPAPDELWWNSEIGEMLIWYVDGTSSQWVLATTGGDGNKWMPIAGGAFTGPITVPDLVNPADDTDLVPNTKWVNDRLTSKVGNGIVTGTVLLGAAENEIRVFSVNQDVWIRGTLRKKYSNVSPIFGFEAYIYNPGGVATGSVGWSLRCNFNALGSPAGSSFRNMNMKQEVNGNLAVCIDNGTSAINTYLDYEILFGVRPLFFGGPASGTQVGTGFITNANDTIVGA